MIIIFSWNREEKFENIYIFNNLDVAEGKNKATDKLVNDLLLSANELSIYGKSSLIEYNKDDVQQAKSLMEEIKTNPDKAYQTILKNKLKHLKKGRASGSDFNVKPVPK
ncbi:MAG: hypothetical protein IPL84_08370 [Chitinophagaceae bacterium]|nr:hypothetical protein [Chitinophagaceae bacterium]